MGGYLPKKSLTNKDLESITDTSDEWIRSRVGIEKRHIAADNEMTSDLAVQAAKRAMEDARVTPQDIDLIIIATTTPDLIFPSTAALVQAKLDIPPCQAFDIQAVCSGFLYALNNAATLIQSGQAHRALVIGAEVMSRILDWQDRTTCVLFGDGAGAFILEARETEEDIGVIDTKLYADGRYAEALRTKGGVGLQAFGPLTMDGKTVFKHAVEKMANVVLEVCERNKLSLSDIDLVIPHQANQRILSALGERLNLPMEKVVSTIAFQANTSAATIPLSFDHAKRSGQLKSGMKIIVPAMGAGFTWGASYIIL